MATLTDEEMAALEAKERRPALTDEEMAKLEAGPVAPQPEPSRLQRVAAALKSLPAQGLRLGLKAGQYYGNAIAHPIDTAKDLTDMEGTGGAAVRGFGRGSSAGFVDELDGMFGASGEALKTLADPRGGPLTQRAIKGGKTENPMLAAYREHRDQRRHDDEVSQKGSPDAFGAGQFAGAGTMPVAKVGLAGRLAQGAAYGGAYGLGESGADLTKGEVGPALKDMGEGAAVGLATAGAFEGAAALPRAIGSRGSAMRAGARQELVDKGDAMHAKDFASESRRLGGVTTGVMADARGAKEGLLNPNLERPQRDALRDFLESGDAVAMERNAANNLIDRLPARTGQMTEARAAMEAAAARNTPEAAKQFAAEELGKSALKTDVFPRVGRYLQRTIPAAAGSAIGGMLGGAEGLAAGAIAGSAIGAAVGHPGTAFANMMKSPRVRDRIGTGMQVIGAPAAASQRAATGGSQMLEDYLRPKDEEERKKDTDDWFTGR